MWWGGPSSLAPFSWFVWWYFSLEVWSDLQPCTSESIAPINGVFMLPLSFLPPKKGSKNIILAKLKSGLQNNVRCLHISVMPPLCFWSKHSGSWGWFSCGFPPQMLQCYFARLNTMHVHSAPVPQCACWSVGLAARCNCWFGLWWAWCHW